MAWSLAQALAEGVVVIVLALAPNLFDDKDDNNNDNNDNGDNDDDDDDNDDDDDAFVSPLPLPPSLQKRWSLSTGE